jgi:N-acetylmuramoyl-L-alanine amidase
MFFNFPAFSAEIKALRIGQHPDKVRVVFDMDGEMDFQVKIADNPRRLIVHLPSKNWDVSGDVIWAKPFHSINHANTEARLTKLSLPLSSPHIIQSAFMIGGEPNRLVIDMIPVTDIEFKRQLSKTHGPLIVGGEPDVLGDLIASFNDTPYPTQKPKKRIKPIIVIDAGHGGKDPGAVSKGGILEKNITLPMAKTIARTLNESGRYTAKLTRDNDRYIKLYNRVKIARDADADLFISIHADSVGNRHTKGASVYTLSNTASDKQTAKMAARENQADLIGGIDLNIEDEDVSAILIDLSMRETMNQSKIVANNVITNLRGSGVQTLKGPHRYAGFAVLKAPDVPSILIETGFVSNESQARQLLTPAHQKRIAKSLMKSLDKYFEF